ncbi:glycosyltransferase involved in cell wall biosynthesis [Pedobacter sp. UYP24]
MNIHFSIIILTLNEEIHLPRLLNSLEGLDAKIFILDSGSTDSTMNICHSMNLQTLTHAFTDHPSQWHYALNNFKIETPWIIALDADQTLSIELYTHLINFSDSHFKNVDGIYFNRKNYFKGQWIKHGGYFPKYLLKMFRTSIGYSDLSESFDHRFQVPGNTLVWKKGYLIEENLKENQVKFWIHKHNIYSDLAAKGHIKINSIQANISKYSLFDSPNQKNAWLKSIWHLLPLYLRPFLYFTYRLIVLRGILDGKNGIIFHFLQAFWFRLIVDIKIDELKKLEKTK